MQTSLSGLASVLMCKVMYNSHKYLCQHPLHQCFIFFLINIYAKTHSTNIVYTFSKISLPEPTPPMFYIYSHKYLCQNQIHHWTQKSHQLIPMSSQFDGTHPRSRMEQLLITNYSITHSHPAQMGLSRETIVKIVSIVKH